MKEAKIIIYFPENENEEAQKFIMNAVDYAYLSAIASWDDYDRKKETETEHKQATNIDCLS